MDTVDAAKRSQDKDAEIERLKAEGPWQQIKCPYCLKEHSHKPSRVIRNQKALITELCDALEGYAFLPDEDHPGHYETSQLIQRAREATQ